MLVYRGASVRLVTCPVSSRLRGVVVFKMCKQRTATISHRQPLPPWRIPQPQGFGSIRAHARTRGFGFSIDVGPVM